MTVSVTARCEEIGDGVFGYVQPDGGWCLNNAGIITSGARTALVDTVATEARARALRSAVSKVSSVMPGVIVNTHFHGDHTFGNFVFPEAVVVAHERTREEMAAAGLHLTGLWPDVSWGGVDLVLPELTYTNKMVVHVGDVVAELLHVGPAHTTDDTVVWLPAERVLFTGDVVLSGATPFCLMGSVAGSLAAVSRLRALKPKVIVPGHGRIGGPELLDETERYFGWLQRLAKEGVAAGLSPLELAAEADLGEFQDLLDAERLVPNLHRAYIEYDGAEPGTPLDVGALFGEMVRHHGGLPVCHA
ncbi:MBL fold metallo-hydrolase [Amycolatopsis sp. TRM77291]